MVRFVSLTVFALSLAAGQALFKRIAMAIHDQPFLDGLLVLARQPTLYAALTLYGVSTLLWIWILSRVPLIQAYPWTAVSMVIVPLVGWFAFGERATPIFWLGVMLILGGVLLTQLSIRTS